MTDQQQKKIDALRAELAALEAQHEKEMQEREALDSIYQQLLSSLEEANITLDSFIRCHYRDIRRTTVKIEREKAKEKGAVATERKPRIKKTTVKKRRAAKKRAVAITVKIPAGQYTHIPSEPETVFTVKEKGPRPKALKAYAEEVGLEVFLNNCRLEES